MVCGTMVWTHARRRETATFGTRAARGPLISSRAAEFTREHGGEVYVFGRQFSAGYAVLHATTSRPDGISFTPAQGELPVRVLIDDQIDPIRIEVSLLWWPRRLAVDGGGSAGGDVGVVG